MERLEGSDVTSWERWGGRAGPVVRRWQGGGGARVVRWQIRKSERMVKWQGERFLVLFKSWGHRVSLDFTFLFLMLISNGTKEEDRLKIIWRGQTSGRTLLTSNTSC